MPRPNIADHPKANTNGFRENPQNIRPRLGWKGSIAKRLNDDGEIAYKKSDVRWDKEKKLYYVKSSGLDKIIDAVVKQALKGNIQAANFLADRQIGKPKQEMSLEQKVVVPKMDIKEYMPAICPHCGNNPNEPPVLTDKLE